MNLLFDCTKVVPDGLPPLYQNHLADVTIKDISMVITPSSHLLNVTFDNCVLSGDMRDVFTDKVKFVACVFQGVTFTNCDLLGAEFIDCEFYNCTARLSPTTQSDLEDLFDSVNIKCVEPEYDYVRDDMNYDAHSEVVSGTRYATIY